MEGFAKGFQSFGRTVLCFLLMNIFIFLWTLLFIVPGIIKSYAYSMTRFILTENPNVTSRQAIDLSQDIMRGHKGKLFVLHLSFIGWHLLGLLTCGLLGVFFTNPYLQLTEAVFYQDVKADAIARGVITADVLPLDAQTELVQA